MSTFVDRTITSDISFSDVSGTLVNSFLDKKIVNDGNTYETNINSFVIGNLKINECYVIVSKGKINIDNLKDKET